MKSIYTGYSVYGGANTFFAGANTGRGFFGVYDEIANEEVRERVYIIKGGSGTGKSTMMQKIAEEAESAGFGVTRYLCGSDPTSLDAVVLDDRIVVLDGTAPHMRDMMYPGTASALIDVSRFWKNAVLIENREEIVRLCAEKRTCFTSASRYLAAAEKAETESHDCAARLLDMEKLTHYCIRTVPKAPKNARGGSGKVHIYRTHGIGIQGRACTAGYSQLSERYRIADVLGTGTIFLETLAQVYLERGMDVWCGVHPINDRITSLYIPPLSRLYSMEAETGTDGGLDKTIHMTRFLKKEPESGDRGCAKLSLRVASGLIDEAERLFRRAGEVHFRIEEIYRGAMDFRALERYARTVRAEIAAYLAAV